ncbi:RloB family protein [Actinomyces slackii]|uniref:RloB-like protein n=1 Tax=Actinomyces slackii TaxID=52774 RepID=A0A3S4SNK0_9ACTO|nr:RloB family protein [Actinomyces slackii]VEG74167.1 Uncharacterised protein [Actinomyces slackii]
MLLVTNGAVTEKHYLDWLARLTREFSQGVAVTVKYIGGAPSTVVKDLKGPRSDLSAFEEVWIIVDHDGEDRSTFLRECKRLTTRRTIVHGVVSVPCFEVWLNAHYEPVRNYQSQADAQAHYAQLTRQPKGAKTIPDDLLCAEAMRDAVDRCHLPGEALPERDTQGPCPSTTMPHLLASLGLIAPLS